MKKLILIFLAGAVMMCPGLSFAQSNIMGLSSDNGYADFCVYGPAITRSTPSTCTFRIR